MCHHRIDEIDRLLEELGDPMSDDLPIQRFRFPYFKTATGPQKPPELSECDGKQEKRHDDTTEQTPTPYKIPKRRFPGPEWLYLLFFWTLAALFGAVSALFID